MLQFYNENYNTSQPGIINHMKVHDGGSKNWHWSFGTYLGGRPNLKIGSHPPYAVLANWMLVLVDLVSFFQKFHTMVG